MRPPMKLRRTFAGAGAVLFLGMFFALPLYVALTLCAMPCCQEEDVASAACATACSIRASEATAAAMPTVVPEKRVETALTATVAMIDPPVVLAAPEPVPIAHRDAPLNILFSVFRI